MDEVQKKVIEIVNANIEQAFLTSEQTEKDLSALGMDSITFIRTIVALEEEFDIEIPDEYLMLTEMNTMSRMADVISTMLDNQNNSIGE